MLFFFIVTGVIDILCGQTACPLGKFYQNSYFCLLFLHLITKKKKNKSYTVHLFRLTTIMTVYNENEANYYLNNIVRL